MKMSFNDKAKLGGCKKRNLQIKDKSNFLLFLATLLHIS